MGRNRNGGQPEEAKLGHNSNLNENEKLKLSGIISEVERLNATIADYNSQKSEIFKAAKEQGFDTKAVKHLIALRKMESSKRNDFENALAAYQHAMGDFVSTPLGAAMAPSAEAH
jgi:uncharacterized protein (UPF0335 family)